MRRALVPAGAALVLSALAAHAAEPELVSRYIAAGKFLAAQQCMNAQCVQVVQARMTSQAERRGIACFLDGLDEVSGSGSGEGYVARLEALAAAAEGRGAPPAPPTEQEMQNWQTSLSACGVGTEKREG